MEDDDSSRPEHIERGDRGERLAAEYLRDNGWEIETMNYENDCGEIDILARRDVDEMRGSLVAFVEVKTRSSPGRMTPELAVTRKKRRTITNMAREYDRVHGRARTGYRFDVIGVDLSESPPEIRHFDGAFDAGGNPY